MNSIRKILEAVAKEHPYKIPSRRETYDKYNEGWTDAVDRIESMLPEQTETQCYLGSPCEYQNPDVEIAQLSQEGTTKDATTDLQPICNDAISRKAVKDLLIYNWDECCSACIGEVEEMPSVTQELLYRGAISLDKQEILQAGYEGREYDFYIGGRLFSIREKAQ